MTKPVAKAAIAATIPVMRAAPVGDERNGGLGEPGWFVAEMLAGDVFTLCGALSELVMMVAVAVPGPGVVRGHLKEADWRGAKFPIVVESAWPAGRCSGRVIETAT